MSNNYGFTSTSASTKSIIPQLGAISEEKERGQSSFRAALIPLSMVATIVLMLFDLKSITRNSLPTHNNTIQSERKCTPPTVAIMIAGQFGRFIFRDNQGPLVTATWWGCGEPIVDVFIAIHRGKLTKQRLGDLVAVPYMNNNVSIADIQNYYLEERNATNVHVLIVNDEHMSKVDNETLHQVNIAQNVSLKARENFRSRFVLGSSFYSTLARCRMFYMFHLAYMMTLEDQKQYDIYVRVREDNFFYEPLNLDFSESLLEATKMVQPYVVVEEGCKWGAYSDKIHIGNQFGMSTLYGNDRNDFFDLIIRYVEFGHSAKGRTFQAESFFQSLLAGAFANVREVNLKRVDVRYNGKTNKKCVAYAYYKCLPDSGKLILSEKFAIMSCNGG